MIAPRFLRLGIAVLSLWAASQTSAKVHDIIENLGADSFWRNRANTIKFVYTFDDPSSISNHPSQKAEAPASQFLEYEGFGIVSNNNSRATLILNTQSSSTSGTLPQAVKVFVTESDVQLFYYLYPTNETTPLNKPENNKQLKHSGSTNEQKTTNLVAWKPGLRLRSIGEAAVGNAGCNCTERFVPFPMTPQTVIDKLQMLVGAQSVITNIGGETRIIVSGEPPNEGSGALWKIQFIEINNRWLPVHVEIAYNSKLYSTIVTEFDTSLTHYAPTNILVTMIQPDGSEVKARWSEIFIRPTTELDVKKLEGLDVMPPRIMVTDYRFERSFAYQMGSRPPSTNELMEMAASDAGVRKYQTQTSVSPFKKLNNQRPSSRLGAFILLLIVAVPSIFYFQRLRSKTN